MWKLTSCLAGMVFVAGCATAPENEAETTGTDAKPSAAIVTAPATTNVPIVAQLPVTKQGGAEKPAEKPVAQPAPPKGLETRNVARGAVATVSSTSRKFPAELPPSALVDGNLTTRWSSAYAEYQTVELKLEKSMRLAKLRLHWESAVATKYSVSVSTDGKTWNGIHAFLNTGAKAEPRVDEINLNNAEARFIRLDLTSRVSPLWGFSLYEIEVIPGD